MLPTTVDRRNTHITDVTRVDRKVRITTITTRALRPQWECYLTKKTRGVGRKWPWEWREPRSASMYLSPSRRCRSLISYADHPRRWLTCRALSYSSLAADYLWLAIAKAVGRCPVRLKLLDAAEVRVGGIKQLQSFERRREWRDLMHDKLTIGIGFHMRTLPAPPPLVSMYRFPTICSEAVCPHTAYQIVVGGQRGSACVVRFGSGQNKFVQLLIRSRNSSGRFVRSLLFGFCFLKICPFIACSLP